MNRYAPAAGYHLPVALNQNEAQRGKGLAYLRHIPVRHGVVPDELRPSGTKWEGTGRVGLRHDGDVWHWAHRRKSAAAEAGHTGPAHGAQVYLGQLECLSVVSG